MTFGRDVRPQITAEAQRLAPHLHEGVAGGLGAARRRLAGLSHQSHPVLLPLVMRAEVRECLQARGLPEGWTITGESRLMEQLLLVHTEYRFTLRFLKERRRSYPGGIQPAGRNRARRDVWSSPTLDLGPEFEPRVPDVITFLWVWDLQDPHDLDGGFSQRLVHTVEPGVYGRAVPCDLSLELLPGGEIFDRLTFVGDPALTDLFAVEVDESQSDEA